MNGRARRAGGSSAAWLTPPVSSFRCRLLQTRDHHYREREVDGPFPALSTDAEAIHANVVREGLADAVGVTGVREGPGQQSLQRYVELVEAGPYDPQPEVAEQSGQFRQRQGPDVR